jgi:hypothetical protein
MYYPAAGGIPRAFRGHHGCIHSPRALELVDDYCLRLLEQGFQDFFMDPSNTNNSGMEYGNVLIFELIINDKF